MSRISNKVEKIDNRNFNNDFEKQITRTVKNAPKKYDDTKRILCIDGDSILYTANHSTEDDILECKHKVYNKIQEITNNVEERFNIIKTVIVVGGKNNFRYKLYPEYKKNRPEKHPNIAILKQYIIESCGAIEAEYGEADDYLYNLHLIAKGNVVLATIDKDIKANMPGVYYNYRSYDDVQGKFEYVSKKEQKYRLAHQIITGDASDGINFSPKIGKAYADKVLHKEMTHYQYIKEVYKAYLKAWKNDSKIAKEKIKLAYLLLKLHSIEEIKQIEKNTK